MRSFPEDFELESFFECVPELRDNEAPWAYNKLVLNVKVKNGLLTVKVTGYEIMDVTWKQGEHTALKLDLKDIQSHKINDERNTIHW